MKKHIIIIESDELKEIERIKKLLEVANVEFNYLPSMDSEVISKTKNYFSSLIEKFKW